MLDAIRGQIAPQADDPLVWGWIAGLLITQLVVQTLAAAAGPFKKHPGLFAHQVCSMAAILATAGSGVYYWFTVADSIQDRLYDVEEGGQIVARLNLSFQVYDLAATLAIRPLRKPEMVVHHSLACMLAYLLLRDDYSNYYSIFFFGMTEVSSIPLCIVDVFKHFRELAKKHEAFNSSCRILFAAIFLSLRCIYWPFISFRYFSDCYHSYQAGTMHSVGLMVFFSASNVFLTLLQWYWGSLIVKAALKMARGGSSSSSSDNGKSKKK